MSSSFPVVTQYIQHYCPYVEDLSCIESLWTHQAMVMGNVFDMET